MMLCSTGHVFEPPGFCVHCRIGYLAHRNQTERDASGSRLCGCRVAEPTYFKGITRADLDGPAPIYRTCLASNPRALG